MAWPRTATPACCRIWARVSSAVSEAISVSLIRDAADEMFSSAILKLLTVESSRFWTAPRLALKFTIAFKAESSLRRESDALLLVERSTVLIAVLESTEDDVELVVVPVKPRTIERPCVEPDPATTVKAAEDVSLIAPVSVRV